VPLRALVSQTLTTPGSTTAYRSRRLISRIRFIRVSTIITPPPMGKQPPDRLVPAPRGRNGTPAALQIFTISATSSVLRGKDNHIGAVLLDREAVALVNDKVRLGCKNTLRSDGSPQSVNEWRVERSPS